MSAVLSDDGVYRYWLERSFDGVQFGQSHHSLVFCMLNPSTADAEKDDPTIRRCISFARRERANGIIVVNVYGLRSTKPENLWKAKDPIGPDNGRFIVEAARRGHVICAWGVNARPEHVKNLRSVFLACGTDILCLGTTKDGHPRHPLYVRGDQPLIPWSPR